MKNKLIILFISLVLGILFILIFINNRPYNIDSIKDKIINNYSEFGLRELDLYDVSMYFGIDLNDIPSSVFLTDFVESDENIGPFLPKHLVIVINSNKIDEYYNILKGYLDVNKSSFEDIKIINRFENAILKRNGNKLYLILGSNKKEIERIIK
ncbi:MAG: hypothetical protein IKF82_06870 [Bacilli bacterium]|nr:hypothetical protein [Bacilli bacterium]